MFSSLSTMADRNFIVGFFLPVLIAALVALGLFHDAPPISELWSSILDLDKFAGLTILVVLLWAGALLLQLFNLELYRVLEGYSPPLNSAKRLQEKIDAFKAARQHTTDLYNAQLADPARSGEYLEALQAFRRDYPPEPRLVLPTTFGNVLRAFEAYPFAVYGIDGVPGWLRLGAVIPDAYAKGLDAARADVDFFVNLCFLALGVAGLCVLRSIFSLGGMIAGSEAMADSLLIYLLVALAAVAFSYLAYRAAILRAYAWGDLVRSAFDLYLPDLAKQLGYTLPDSLAERRVFWDAINSLFLYNTPVDPLRWKDAPPAAPVPPPPCNITLVAQGPVLVKDEPRKPTLAERLKNRARRPGSPL